MVTTVNQVSEIEIHYKRIATEKFKITDSKTSYEILKQVFDANKIGHVEFFHVLYLNRSNEVLSSALISQGGCNSTVVDAKVVFQGALLANASGLILAHNHPSGAVKPSRQDIVLTENLVQLGKLLDLPVMDHLILGADTYLSFADEGLI